MNRDSVAGFNGEDDDEAALQQAIALSLEGSSSNPPIDSPYDPVDQLVTTPSRDIQHVSTAEPTASSSNAPVKPKQSQPPPPSNSFAALGLNRKQMEEERLARLNKTKRKASQIEDVTEGSRQSIRVKKATDNSAVLGSITGTSQKPSADSKSGPQYPQGVVKRTWARGYPRTDDIKIEEVFQKEKLELAVLSSFQWDDEWFLTKIDTEKTKMILITFAFDDSQKASMQKMFAGPKIKFCFPPMETLGCMHSKLQLLKFPSYLRVVVPTGNLVPYDWGENGLIENMVFLIDLPLIEDEQVRAANQLTLFGEELATFLRAQGVQESIVDSLMKYDFSKTKRLGFIHTIGGSHSDSLRQRTGYCGLGRIVKALGLDTPRHIDIDYLSGSLGSLQYDFLAMLYFACQGDSGMKEYNARSMRGTKAEDRRRGYAAQLKDKFRIYFPTLETVEGSRGGKDAGGTICLQQKFWDQPLFPREFIRDSKNTRQGLLLHSKVMFVRPSQDDGQAHGWAYVGSANLSESAWGRLVKERGTGNPKLNCRNWECGVLIPADSVSEQDAGPGILQHRVPIPVELPGEAYGTSGSKAPWLYQQWHH